MINEERMILQTIEGIVTRKDKIVDSEARCTSFTVTLFQTVASYLLSYACNSNMACANNFAELSFRSFRSFQTSNWFPIFLRFFGFLGFWVFGHFRNLETLKHGKPSRSSRNRQSTLIMVQVVLLVYRFTLIALHRGYDDRSFAQHSKTADYPYD